MIPTSKPAIPERLREIADIDPPLDRGERNELRKFADEIGRQQAELKASLALNRQGICTYCGHVATLPEGEDRNKGIVRLMTEHIANCERHPLKRIAEVVDPIQQENDSLKAELERLRGEREQAVLRTGCKSCRGLGHIERHRDDYLHFETDIGDICPSWHFETLPCAVCHSTVVAISTEAGGEREQDTARLDWYMEHYVSIKVDQEHKCWVHFYNTGRMIGPGNTPRDAIDGARDAVRAAKESK